MKAKHVAVLEACFLVVERHNTLILNKLILFTIVFEYDKCIVRPGSS